jgi:NhaP-type Na+/H+ or K+/H+ antiporter
VSDGSGAEVTRIHGIGLGSLAGAAVGWAGGWLMRGSYRRGWSTESFEGLGVLVLAALSFFAAETIHGNGFLAAFVAGLAFGFLLRGIQDLESIKSSLTRRNVRRPCHRSWCL